MNFQNLKAIANGTRDAQHAAFGTHFAKNASVEVLNEKATVMIQNCKRWIENWETIQEGIKPELDEIRNKQLKATAEKFVGYSDEQLDALFEQVKLLKGESSVAQSYISILMSYPSGQLFF